MLVVDMMLFFSKIPVDQILKNREKVEEIIPELPGELIIKEFPTGRATISTIESHIRKVTDLGIKPDLVIIDYVDLLSTKKELLIVREKLMIFIQALKDLLVN
jgi:hypothetical protein